jgi:hypothetical protein
MKLRYGDRHCHEDKDYDRRQRSDDQLLGPPHRNQTTKAWVFEKVETENLANGMQVADRRLQNTRQRDFEYDESRNHLVIGEKNLGTLNGATGIHWVYIDCVPLLSEAFGHVFHEGKDFASD